MSRIAAAVLTLATSVAGFGAFNQHPSCPTCETTTCPPPAAAPTCPALTDTLKANEPDHALLQMAYSSGNAQNFLKYIKDAKPIGHHTALIAEASDASRSGAPVLDGQSGDVDFPHGNLKVLATVGEYWPGNGEFYVGVPDGMGTYLKDDHTVRYIVQSESYGQLRIESYPWGVNGDVATFTGSHVQYIDIDRDMLAKFMEHSHSAESMIRGAGSLIQSAYNLAGEPVGPRARAQTPRTQLASPLEKSVPTTYGAHFSNTDAAGNFVVGNSAIQYPSQADWLMQSLCSAHMVPKHQWGPSFGVEDSLFLTNEEWINIVADVDYVGLSAHAIDVATHTAYAIGAMSVGGFEKVRTPPPPLVRVALHRA